MILKTKLFGKVYEFKSLREVMAKANEEKSGDKLGGIAAESAEERVAAKVVLSHITLEDLRNNPAVPYEEDEVTRIIQDGVNEAIYREHKNKTVAEFREWLLDTETTGDMIKRNGSSCLQTDEQPGFDLCGKENPDFRTLQHHHRTSGNLLFPSAAKPYHR